MAIKNAMLALRTYPDPTTKDLIASAISLAGLLDCRLSAFAPEILIRVPGTLLGNSLLDISGLAAHEMGRSTHNATELKKIFRDLAELNGLSYEVIEERAVEGEIPALTAEYARLKDLIILPVSSDEFIDRWDTETVIFNSARPVLLMPEGRTPAKASISNVGVAWDYSRAAARAIADAMPILERAQTVNVVTVHNEKTFDITRKTHEIGAYLARHQVNAVIHEIDAAGRQIGEVLTDSANSLQLDLLVMGAYGHSRFREFVLGGATRSMLAKPPLPTLLSH